MDEDVHAFPALSFVPNSGLYDLKPIRHTYLNEDLRLTEGAAVRNGLLMLMPGRIAMVIAAGGIEPGEFHRL